MKPLTKLLKASFLQSFFRKAQGLTGENVYFTVFSGEKLFASVGNVPQDIPENFKTSDGFVSRPLVLEGITLGHIIAGYETETVSENGFILENAVEFLGDTLNEIIKREHTTRSLGQETLEQYRETALMQRAVVSLNSSMKLRDVVDALLRECRDGAYPAQYGMVFLMEESDDEYACLGSYSSEHSEDTRPDRKVFERITKSRLFKEIMAREKGEIINDVESDIRWDNEVEFISSLLIMPLQAPRLALGALVLAGDSSVEEENRYFTAGHLKRISVLASAASVAMANAFHFEQVQKIMMSLMQSLATAIDARDQCTSGHSRRVAHFALGLARLVNRNRKVCPDVRFSEGDLQEIFYAGLLHDVGKIGVREEVLTKATRLPATHLELIGLRLALWGKMKNKAWEDIYARLEMINKAYDLSDEDIGILTMLSREVLEVGGNNITVIDSSELERLLTPRGNLTEAEWNEIKRHPMESYRILKNIPFRPYFPNILVMIRQHHERLDGSGYPEGTTGEGISPQSRILAIVDVYDALRKDRHYKKAISQEMAVRILREEAALGRLDERFVEIFTAGLDDLEADFAAESAGLTAPELMQ